MVIQRPITIAGVEGGGTSFIATIAIVHSVEGDKCIPNTRLEILHHISIPSMHPEATLKSCASFFESHRPIHGYAALGIATFGPVGVNHAYPATYGRICNSSPKKEWRNVNILSPILQACTSVNGIAPPYRIETDVNAPAMAEFMHVSKFNDKITSLAYVTVGTGIGVGLVINSKPVHGMMHPEAGHVATVSLSGDLFDGYSWGKDSCPFRGKGTVEGMACSVALTERLLMNKDTSDHIDKENDAVNNIDGKLKENDIDGITRECLKDIPDSHEIWDHAANALANLCVTLTLVTSVERIVFGGGVMNRNILYKKIRERTRKLLNGYLDHLDPVSTVEGLDDYIGPSIWKDQAGLVGALVLAQSVYEEQKGIIKEKVDIVSKITTTNIVQKYDVNNQHFWNGLFVGAALTGFGALGVTMLTKQRRN